MTKETRVIGGELFDVYNLKIMSGEDKVNLIKQVEFEVKVYQKGIETEYRLIDLQGANIGGIEDMTYHSIDEMIDRLDIYWNDYQILFE